MAAPPRRLRIALHAFPRRFRTAREPEIAATFRDAQSAGDPHPYGLRALIDVVRAGWSERLRTRPPLASFLKYRLLDGRLDPQWHRWMLDDVHGWFGVRRSAWSSLAPFLVLMLLLRGTDSTYPDDALFVGLFVASMFVMSLISTPTHRRRILRRHGYDPVTLTWASPADWAATAPRARRSTRVAPVAFTTAMALAVVAPFAVLASLGRIGADAGNVTREADGQLPLTVAAIAVAVALAVGAGITRRWFARRFTMLVEDSTGVQLVYSDLPSAVGLSAAVAAVGVMACVWPLTPLVVPIAFVVATGAIPVLVAVGLDARRRSGEGALVVWRLRTSLRRAGVGRH